MLLEPQPTSYDLRFGLFGTQVRVHPFFWIMTLVLGWSAMAESFGFLLIWVLCVFISILLHEFGHIWMGKLFGTSGYIVLYSFGGLAVGSNDLHVRWQRILVSLAGPAIQLALYGVVIGIEQSMSIEQLAQRSETLEEFFLVLKYVNLYWPLFNLLPIWPLDGGMVARELCTMASRREGLRVSLILSGVVAAIIALNAVYATRNGGRGLIPRLPTGGMWTVILFGMLSIESFQLLSIAKQPWRYEEPDDRLPWER